MRLLFLFSIFLGHVPAFAQFIGGNTGEGVRVNNEIHLMDFYQADLNEDLWFGNEISDGILAVHGISEALPLTGPQKNLLLRKLSDIEDLTPCLGQTLARLLPLFHWSFEDRPLDLLPEEPGRRHVPAAFRVLIANRRLNTISVHRASWDLMPDAHKVGLIIHELAFSMVRPVRVKPEERNAKQDVLIARDLVAKFFSVPSESRPTQIQVLMRALDVPERPAFCPSEEKLSVELFSADEASLRKSETQLASSTLSRRSVFREICEFAAMDIRASFVEIQGLRSPIQVEFRRYHGVSQNPLEVLMAVRTYFVETSMSQRIPLSMPNSMTCRQTLEATVGPWFSGLYPTPPLR